MACRLPLAVVVGLGLLSGCARPTGDFGRAKPSVVHDEIMPATGKRLARLRREPVSGFNLTDRERELRDRAWTLVRPPHARDWKMAVRVEWQRTRMTGIVDPSFDPQSYYDHLRRDPYISSEARWNRVMADATADAALVSPFYAVVRPVRRDDAERIAALGRRIAVSDREVADAYDRVAENTEVVAWACRALQFRLAAYRDAIDRMEVETPSDRVWEANRAWSALAAAIAEPDGCMVAVTEVFEEPLYTK